MTPCPVLPRKDCGHPPPNPAVAAAITADAAAASAGAGAGAGAGTAAAAAAPVVVSVVSLKKRSHYTHRQVRSVVGTMRAFVVGIARCE